MKMQRRNQTFRGRTWQVPLAIGCIGLVLLLIAGTIILGLIPIYLPSKDINTNRNFIPLNALYASNASDASSLTLADTSQLSLQMQKILGMLSRDIRVQSGQFMPTVARKKRQTVNGVNVCEQETGLQGDFFVMQYQFKYPHGCDTPVCQQRFLKKMQDRMRMDYKKFTVPIGFTNGEELNVQFAFCSFSIPGQWVLAGCTLETSKYIYLLDQDGKLFQFNPKNLDLTVIGTLNCSTTAYPYSMAMQRDGTAWTLYTDGNLYKFDIKTLQCQSTSFITDPDELFLFGMGFGMSRSNTNEVLFISSDASNLPYHLGRIDLVTLEISTVGFYDTLSARAELTSTNDGRLFGIFEGTPYIAAEINKTNGEILSKLTQDKIQYVSDSSNFAFVSYGSNFFLFAGNHYFTDIFFYNPSTNMTIKQNTISEGIVSATSVSTCLRAS